MLKFIHLKIYFYPIMNRNKYKMAFYKNHDRQ